MKLYANMATAPIVKFATSGKPETKNGIANKMNATPAFLKPLLIEYLTILLIS